jgi:hypothetical protein
MKRKARRLLMVTLNVKLKFQIVFIQVFERARRAGPRILRLLCTAAQKRRDLAEQKGGHHPDSDFMESGWFEGAT